MKLNNKLYSIESQSIENGEGHFLIRMNPLCEIYAAHFPGDPITPGVCILQIGLDLVGLCAGCPVEIIQVKNMKFLSILRPEGADVEVNLRIGSGDGGAFKAQADLSREGTPVAKMSLICRKIAR